MRKFHVIVVQCWRVHHSFSLLPIIMSYYGYNTESWWEQWHEEGLRTLISPFKTRLGKERWQWFQDEMKAAVRPHAVDMRQQGSWSTWGRVMGCPKELGEDQVLSTCQHEQSSQRTSTRLESRQGGSGKRIPPACWPPSYLTTSWCQQSTGPLEVTVPLGPFIGGFRTEDGGIRWSHQWLEGKCGPVECSRHPSVGLRQGSASEVREGWRPFLQPAEEKSSSWLCIQIIDFCEQV